MDSTQEILDDFVTEACEALDLVDEDLLALESNPGDVERIASVFRQIHTIKGTSGFLGLSRLESLAHTGENLLSDLRDGKVVMDMRLASTLLVMGDSIRAMIKDVEVTGKEGETEIDELIELLRSFQTIDSDEPVEIPPAPIADAPAVPEVAEVPAVPEAAEVSARKPITTERSVRVDVQVLDDLMNLVGELVLARNQILRLTDSQRETDLSLSTQRLNLITTELQEHVMNARMQPISKIWGKFPRMARDLGISCNKQVKIRMEGEATELDRTVLETIRDPLVHLVRNSIDHGIESPEQRRAAGKREEGEIHLHAYHDGGQVIVEITDDGAGLDFNAIRKRAISNGLLSGEAAKIARDGELARLIFQAGFSTADQVTNVSGRGVGMDVVKTNIEAIGGTVEISSTAGQGTTFRVRLPLTLAIIPALIVRAGDQQFAIPQGNLLELLRLDVEAEGRGVEIVHSAPVVRLRGDLLPLISLAEVMCGESGTRIRTDIDLNVVVVQAGQYRMGLVVDEVADTEEIVVKPMSRSLRSVSIFAGATVMGDGSVALILDIGGLAKQVNLQGDKDVGAGAAEQDLSTGASLFLVVEGLKDRHLAIRLRDVARLEEFSPSEVEYSLGRRVIQYRGDVMPLVGMNEIQAGPQAVEPPGSSIQVVVHRSGDQICGLVVGDIVDVLSSDAAVDKCQQTGAMVGRVVLNDRVADVVDLATVACISQQPASETLAGAVH